MSIPMMLAFDARSVLSLDGIGFSNGKLARMFAAPGFDEGYFRTIPFEQVYHDGPTRDEGIQDARMSEVVYPGPLSIDPHKSGMRRLLRHNFRSKLIRILTKKV